MKEPSLFKALIFLFLGSMITSCAAINQGTRGNQTSSPEYLSNLMVPNQIPAPQSIKSIQLYRKGSPNNPPAITLNSGQKLVLEFDELSDLSGQFRITFTHHDGLWQSSNIPEDWYLSGMNELIMGGGTINRHSEPDYHHYRIEFPNQQLNFKASGNYMLNVSDFSSGVLLFTLPFFVTENEGEMVSHVETVFNAGPRGAPIDQPFSTFTYPDFVEFPQFDLTYFFAQNRFWGKTRQTEVFDVVDEGNARFYLPREEAFPSNFDFIGLSISRFSQGGKIIEWNPGITPPQAVLREDVLNFSSIPTRGWSSNYGVPKSGRDARYANVRFRFEDGGQFSQNQGVYLTGDFNQWLLSEQHKLSFNPESGYWETDVLLKEGTYTYKYALQADGEVDDLLLSDSVTRNRQEYASFVYYSDPEYHFQRLLQLQFFYSE